MDISIYICDMENILINGKGYKWEEINVNILGVPITGITPIFYESKKYILPKIKTKKIRVPRKLKKKVNKTIKLIYPKMDLKLPPYKRILLYNSIYNISYTNS